MKKIISNFKFQLILFIALTLLILYIFSEKPVYQKSYTGTFNPPPKPTCKETYAIIRGIEYIEKVPFSRRKSKEYYLSTIVYEANELTFTEKFEIDKMSIENYKTGDTLKILYQISNPSSFEILGSTNTYYNLEEDRYFELMKKGTSSL